VVLIAANYRGRQQATALGVLAGIPAVASASFLIVGAISVLAIFPASRLPRYVPGELPAEDIVSEAGPGEREAGSPA
jgi:hypothetical protein